MRMPMNSNIALLKGLADKNRLWIINLLLKHDFCVGALSINYAHIYHCIFETLITKLAKGAITAISPTF